MKKFIVTDDFWDIFPDAQLSVVIAKGIDNTENISPDYRKEIKKALRISCEEAEKHLPSSNFSSNQVIAIWREAFQKFKTKKGVRCSIEALLKRIEKGSPVSAINPLVDIYNTASLTFGVPCGGEDIDTFDGNLYLTKADGNEPFQALGDEVSSMPYPEELVYKDNTGVVCRCLNWRDGQRTMLTENTKNAFLIIESVDPAMHQSSADGANQIAENISKYLGGEVMQFTLTKENKEIEF